MPLNDVDNPSRTSSCFGPPVPSTPNERVNPWNAPLPASMAVSFDGSDQACLELNIQEHVFEAIYDAQREKKNSGVGRYKA